MSSDTGTVELSVVIAVLDEEETIAAVVDELVAALPGDLGHEVVLVDDGSRDRTPEVLAELESRHPNVRSVAHRRNRGKSAALVTGARAARGHWIATMDGDGQNDPRDVLRMLDEARSLDGEERPYIVCGCRKRRRDTIVKRLSSRIANGVRSLLLHDATPDTACGLKVVRRTDFLELPRFDNMHRFLPALVLREGGAARSVMVEDRPRAGGTSKYGLGNRLWVGISDLLGVLWLLRRSFPSDREETR